MEGIEKLRKDADHITEQAQGNYYSRVRNIIRRHADEIEREIAERYMELPVDADGVPIHMGDTLQLGDTRGEVVALTYCPSNGKFPWEWQCDTGGWHKTAFARHAKPRTLEDVLEDFAIGVREEDGFSEEQVRCCADEIRGMFGGDAE